MVADGRRCRGDLSVTPARSVGYEVLRLRHANMSVAVRLPRDVLSATPVSVGSSVVTQSGDRRYERVTLGARENKGSEGRLSLNL
jgi:hypothetical protein